MIRGTVSPVGRGIASDAKGTHLELKDRMGADGGGVEEATADGEEEGANNVEVEEGADNEELADEEKEEEDGM